MTNTATWSEAARNAVARDESVSPETLQRLVTDLTEATTTTASRLLGGLDLTSDALIAEIDTNWSRVAFTTMTPLQPWIDQRITALGRVHRVDHIDSAAVITALLWPAGPDAVARRDIITRFGITRTKLTEQLRRVDAITNAQLQQYFGPSHDQTAAHEPATDSGPLRGATISHLLDRAYVVARNLHGTDAPITTGALLAALATTASTPDLLDFLAGAGIGPVSIGMIPVARTTVEPGLAVVTTRPSVDSDREDYPASDRAAATLALIHQMAALTRDAPTARHVTLALTATPSELTDRLASYLHPNTSAATLTADVMDLVGITDRQLQLAQQRERSHRSSTPSADLTDITPTRWAALLLTTNPETVTPTNDLTIDTITARFERHRTTTAQNHDLDTVDPPAHADTLARIAISALVDPEPSPEDTSAIHRLLHSHHPHRSNTTTSPIDQLVAAANHHARSTTADRRWPHPPSGLPHLARTLADRRPDLAAASLLIEARRLQPTSPTTAGRNRPSPLYATDDIATYAVAGRSLIFIDIDEDNDSLTLVFDGHAWKQHRASIELADLRAALDDRVNEAPRSTPLGEQLDQLASTLGLTSALTAPIDLYLTGRALNLPIPAAMSSRFDLPTTTHLLGGLPGLATDPPNSATLVVHPPPNDGDALPFAEIEAHFVASTTRATATLAGMAASRAWIARALAGPSTVGGPRFVHYAGHGELRQRPDGMTRPVLVTLDNEALATEELATLSPDIDLLFCAACDLGSLSPDSPASTSWPLAALQAGVGHVVAGLWPIDDALSGLLVTHFYQHYAGGLLAAGVHQSARWLASLDSAGLNDHIATLISAGVQLGEIERRTAVDALNDPHYGASQPEAYAALGVFTA